jgi:hypothetical protein
VRLGKTQAVNGGHGERRAFAFSRELMTTPNETKSEPKAERAAKRAAARAAKRLADQETANHRTQQLETARSVAERIEQRIQTARANAGRYEALRSQLQGYYEEIDKLAKGKTMLEVTDLVVEQTNDIIRDAKLIIEGDTYLDRVKEFVPAGDNPVYPDILLVLRTIQQSLSRYGSGREDREKGLIKTLQECRTIVAALECYSDGDKYALKENVKSRLESGVPVATWFWEDEYANSLFDFDRLDRRNLEDFFGRQF